MRRRDPEAKRLRGIPSLGLLLALLVLGLAACVPTVAIDRTVAYDATPVGVEPGTTVRVVVPFGYGDFRLEPGDLDPLPFPEIVFQPRENVTGRFVLRAVDAPEGWAVALDRVERVVTRIDEVAQAPSGDDRAVSDAGRTYSLDVFLRVAVPADADPGSYSVAATIRARNTVESTVRMTFTIPRGSPSGRLLHARPVVLTCAMPGRRA